MHNKYTTENAKPLFLHFKITQNVQKKKENEYYSNIISKRKCLTVEKAPEAKICVRVTWWAGRVGA